MKFRMTKRTHLPLGCAKFHMNGYNESPLLDESAVFRPLSKLNTGNDGAHALHHILPVCIVPLVCVI